jgi:hypothetical protein
MYVPADVRSKSEVALVLQSLACWVRLLDYERITTQYKIIRCAIVKYFGTRKRKKFLLGRDEKGFGEGITFELCLIGAER